MPRGNPLPQGYVHQYRGGGASARPIIRVLERFRFDADQRGEIHLTLCEHQASRPGPRPRLYLHVHNLTVGLGQDPAKPAAMNAWQLAAFITKLQAIHTEMTSSEPFPPSIPGAC